MQAGWISAHDVRDRYSRVVLSEMAVKTNRIGFGKGSRKGTNGKIASHSKTVTSGKVKIRKFIFQHCHRLESSPVLFVWTELGIEMTLISQK
ncbi:hypothetical protein FBUS_04807 [Fasciolopsis buskii]|uniref:Uncharacterized protein n=1 Tax=Fasciolopsis buskii TaxID=27845 RepID=A0A8E0RTC1_9TREM|nr:hypothetical protein FBUS_04807 [Fasciolopsis buski]